MSAGLGMIHWLIDLMTEWLTGWLIFFYLINYWSIDWFFIILEVFDAYAQFEESMISAKMETTAEMGATEEGKKHILSCITTAQKYRPTEILMLVL